MDKSNPLDEQTKPFLSTPIIIDYQVVSQRASKPATVKKIQYTLTS